MIGFIFVMGIFFAVFFIVIYILIFVFMAIVRAAKQNMDTKDAAKKAAKISVVLTTILTIAIGIAMWSDGDFRTDFMSNDSDDDSYVWEYDETQANRREDDRRDETQESSSNTHESRARRREDDRREEPTADYTISADSESESTIRSGVYNWEYRDTSLRTHDYTVKIELLEENIRASQEYIDRMNRLAYQWDQELFREVGVSASTDPEEVYVAIVQAIYADDESRLSEVAAGFEEIGISEGFDEMGLLYFVVTMIQNITYQAPGGDTDIFPPTVTLSRQYGDCDTVSLLAYVILEKLGYDVAMLASEEYAHAMLGVNAPATGNYIQYDGVKYYTLEMTYPDWWLGEIDSSCENLRYWYAFKM